MVSPEGRNVVIQMHFRICTVLLLKKGRPLSSLQKERIWETRF